MFVDELDIEVRAGDGGNGVVRWRRERYRPNGGPAGGNGGKGGDVFLRAVRDLGLLSKYTGSKIFEAGDGEPGRGNSQYGKAGDDLYIDVPVGAKVTDIKRGRVYALEHVGEIHKILLGGGGGLGNEYFKSSTNRSPEESTAGKKGEQGTFFIELALVVDAGIIGLPNAGKSTLLNSLTHAKSKVGAYPFTTTEPHLGSLFGLVLADIPGLIEGASEGKGLGHKFLRHVERTKMLLHCVSLENEDILQAYNTVHAELKKHSEDLIAKEEWVVLTKSDLVSENDPEKARAEFNEKEARVFVVSAETGEGIKELQDALTQHFA
jgi:GTP-binding protein